MNRIDRLFAILLRISDGKVFRAETLAAEFELSDRTVYRDMKALMDMGIPLRSEAGVGYQLGPGYFLPPLLFERDEAFAVGFALRFLGANSPDPLKQAATRAFQKVEAVLSPRVRADFFRQLEVLDYVPAQTPIPFTDPTFRALTEAIHHRHVVHLEYVSYGKQSPEPRRIEPVRMFLAPGENRWYVDAFCLTRNAWRAFRLDRIVRLTPTRTLFVPRSRDEGPPPVPDANTPVAEVFVRPADARWVREAQHWSMVAEDEVDGLVRWRYQGFRWPAFCGWVSSLGPWVVRLEPDEARRHLAQHLADLQRLLT